jgi:hypothetical protein
MAPARGLAPGKPTRRAVKVGGRATADPCHAVLRLQDGKTAQTQMQHCMLPCFVLCSDRCQAVANGRRTDDCSKHFQSQIGSTPESLEVDLLAAMCPMGLQMSSGCRQLAPVQECRFLTSPFHSCTNFTNQLNR